MSSQSSGGTARAAGTDGRHPCPDLSGRVALVTGASRGIGAVAARAFVAAGARVALAARDEQALEGVAREIRAHGGEALVVRTDVRDPAAVEQMVRATLDRFGRLDVAFNNAGGSSGSPPMPLADLAVAAFDREVATNLRGTFLSMKYEIPAMLERGGAIVNMSSTAGLQAVGGLAGYVSGKHGIVGLTKSAALDYAARGVRINAVAPGPILTDRLERAGEAARAQAARAMPMQRIGRPEEVATAVVWLCSEQASFITGAVLPVDGGSLAGQAPFASAARR